MGGGRGLERGRVQAAALGQLLGAGEGGWLARVDDAFGGGLAEAMGQAQAEADGGLSVISRGCKGGQSACRLRVAAKGVRARFRWRLRSPMAFLS